MKSKTILTTNSYANKSHRHTLTMELLSIALQCQRGHPTFISQDLIRTIYCGIFPPMTAIFAILYTQGKLYCLCSVLCVLFVQLYNLQRQNIYSERTFIREPMSHYNHFACSCVFKDDGCLKNDVSFPHINYLFF